MADGLTRVLGRGFLAALALTLSAVLLTLLADLPAHLSAALWPRVLGSLGITTGALLSALCSSLTLRTRYRALGILGVLAAALGGGIGLALVLTGAPAAPSPASIIPGGYGPFTNSAAEGSITGALLAAALVAAALPLVNLVLFFAYRSTLLAETTGIVAAVAILGWCVAFGTATAAGTLTPGTMAGLTAGGAVALAAALATPVAALLEGPGILFETDRTAAARRTASAEAALDGYHAPARRETVQEFDPTGLTLPSPFPPAPEPEGNPLPPLEWN